MKSFKCVSRGVGSAQLRQFRIVESLRAETRAIHAKIAKRTQLFALTVPGFISKVISAPLSMLN